VAEERHLRQFIAVVEELHFTRAAKRLGIAQPALSSQIKRLERRLGVDLFRRTRRRVELTAAGRVFLAEARRSLDQLEWAVEAARRAGRGEVGRLALGFVGPATYSVLPPVLSAFHERYPEVELDVMEMNSGLQLPALLAGRLDLGFLRPPDHATNLWVEPVLREGVIVALPRGHPLAAATRVSASDLAGERLLLFRRELEPTLFDAYVRFFGAVAATPRIDQVANPLHLILALVAAGTGVTLAPASTRNLRRPDVVYRPLTPQPPRLVLAAAWRSDDPSPVLAAFVAVMREVTGNR
jgi:DNA-binding transcriptional LysR family regulator